MQNLLYEKHSSTVGLLKINRPEVLNALNHKTLEELLDFLENKELKSQCRALILTGAGEKSFIAGADIKEMQSMTHTELLTFCELGQKVTMALQKAPFLTIAAVNGYALGGGFEMALACDFIYASKSARFGFPEVSLGMIPGFGGTQRFPARVGIPLAKEFIMSGRIFSAEEAKAMQAINHFCEGELLLEESFARAASIANYSPFATQQAKCAINSSDQLPLSEGMELEKNMCAVCFATEECSEAMQHFIEKHKVPK